MSTLPLPSPTRPEPGAATPIDAGAAPRIEPDAPYVLGRSLGEYERRRRQARLLEPLTAPLLHRIGLAPGMRCLDVGCGPGEVMRLMAERVGPAGAVTGVDLDGMLGRHAVASLHALGHTQCAFLEGDIATMPAPAGPRFDVVYARLVLIHADQPLAVLRRMWDLTAPGGVLVVQDYDLDTMASDPPHPAVDEFRRVCLGVFGRAGRSLQAGTAMRRQFAAAAIGLPDGTDVRGLLESIDEARPMLEAVHRSLLPLACAWGITSEERTAAWREELAAVPADVTVRYPLLIGAFRRKSR